VLSSLSLSCFPLSGVQRCYNAALPHRPFPGPLALLACSGWQPPLLPWGLLLRPGPPILSTLTHEGGYHPFGRLFYSDLDSTVNTA